MTIAQLQRLRTVSPGGTDRGRDLPRPGGGGFDKTLAAAIGKVDGAQKEADSQVEAFVAGEQENLHEVMIAMNQAGLYLQLMTEVRNRMLDAYQELIRMQV